MHNLPIIIAQRLESYIFALLSLFPCRLLSRLAKKILKMPSLSNKPPPNIEFLQICQIDQMIRFIYHIFIAIIAYILSEFMHKCSL